MSLEIVVNPLARADSREVFEHIAQESPPAAARFVEGVQQRLESLADMPAQGVQRSDLTPGARVLTFNGQVSIAYIVRAEHVEILRVFYRGRDWERILGRGI